MRPLSGDVRWSGASRVLEGCECLGSGAVKTRDHLPHDIGLGLLALAVLGGAAYSLRAPVPVSTQQVRVERPIASRSPSPSPRPVPAAPTSLARTEQVVLVGPDLVTLDVSAAASVASVTDLEQVAVRPTRVVIEVLAGSRTTVRTRESVLAVRSRWADVPVVVIGPLSANDRLSAAAVKQAAAQLPDVDVLDPVDLGWRTDATSAELTPADRVAVARALELELASG